MSGLIVRVVSKKVANGKLYNKKMRVSDVLSAYQFLAVPIEDADGGVNAYENLVEKEIETVMPKADNEPIAILRGEFKGEIGKMLSRDRKKDEVTIQIGLTDIVKVS